MIENLFIIGTYEVPEFTWEMRGEECKIEFNVMCYTPSILERIYLSVANVEIFKGYICSIQINGDEVVIWGKRDEEEELTVEERLDILEEVMTKVEQKISYIERCVPGDDLVQKWDTVTMCKSHD